MIEPEQPCPLRVNTDHLASPFKHRKGPLVFAFARLGSEQYILKKNWVNRLFYRVAGSHGLLPKMCWYQVIRRIQSLCPDRNYPLLILDAGSGSGGCGFALRKTRPRARVVCVDMVMDRVRECSIIQRQLKLDGVHPVLADIRRLPFSKCFDLAYSIEVLEHIDDDVGALRSLRDALRDDGVLIVHIPRSRFESRTILPCARKIPKVVSDIATDHVRYEYTEQEIRAKLADAGFAIEKFSYSQGTWGRLSFEINSLYMNHTNVRNVLAMLTYPLTTALAYLDAIVPHKTGNAFVIVAAKSGSRTVSS